MCPWSSSLAEGRLSVCWFISNPRVGFDLDVSAEAQAACPDPKNKSELSQDLLSSTKSSQGFFF